MRRSVSGYFFLQLNTEKRMISLSNIFANKLVMLVGDVGQVCLNAVMACEPKEVLLFSRTGPELPERHSGHVSARLRRLSDLSKTNCEVAIFDAVTSLALNKKRYFWETRLQTLLVPKGIASLLYLGGLSYYRKKKRLTIMGEVTLGNKNGSREFLVVSILRGENSHNRRLFAPHDWTPHQILSHMAGLNYVLLRSIDAISAGKDFKDIDILVSDDDLVELRSRFGQKVGLYQIDAYSEGGALGHDFQSVPYFFPRFAREILGSAEILPNQIRVPSAKYRYLSLAYHLLFHGKSRHIEDLNDLSENTFGNARHYHSLISAAGDAGFSEPRSLSDIDAHLHDCDAFPSADILGFYARRNRFVSQRYLSSKQALPGLVTFFTRDYNQTSNVTDAIERALAENFEILAKGPLDEQTRCVVNERVRGGNSRDNVDASSGEPTSWYVCWDPTPISVDRKLRKKYPHLDNARTLALKLRLRELAGGKRILHSSDNSGEALEHVRVLNLEQHPGIAKKIEKIRQAAA